jgi:hypothetical protein
MQRQIVVDSIIPENERKRVALDEIKIGNHLEKFFLAEDNKDRTTVFSCVFGGVHVYCYAPSDLLGRDYWTLVTMGMSGTKMNVPHDLPDRELYARAELLCYLPANWNLPKALGGPITEENWPVEMIRSLANYVIATGNWLADDHGIANLLSEPPGQPFVPSTKLANMILLEPVNEDDGFSYVDVNDERVNFYVVVPLTAAEAQWKREVGAANSIHHIVGSKAIGGENVMVDYIIDAKRPCAIEDLQAKGIVAAWVAEEEADEEEDAEEGELEEEDDEWEEEEVGGLVGEEEEEETKDDK